MAPTTQAPRSLTKALYTHCRCPGETTAQFADELRRLTPADRSTLAEWFNAEGYGPVTV